MVKNMIQKYDISVSCKKDGLRHRVSRSCCWQTSAELRPAAAAWPGMPEMPEMPETRTRNGGDPGLQLWSERWTVHQGRVKHLGLSRKMLAENGGMGTSMPSVPVKGNLPPEIMAFNGTPNSGHGTAGAVNDSLKASSMELTSSSCKGTGET